MPFPHKALLEMGSTGLPKAAPESWYPGGKPEGAHCKGLLSALQRLAHALYIKPFCPYIIICFLLLDLSHCKK